ncbi:MAG: ABC transporter substrate-binding protein [Acidimicrobiales bacterium]
MRYKFSANRRVLAAATAAVMGAGLVTVSGAPSNAAVPAASRSVAPAASGAAPELVMESSPESSITEDFNPYVTTAAPYGMGATGLIYEPLVMFDLAAPPKNYKWLATGYKWSDGGKTITFTIRSGVKWNDGVPLTPADVAFTFNEMKKYPAINTDGLKITSVSTSGDTVSVSFPTPQYANLQSIAGAGVIPEHVWSKVGNPAAFADPNPVGTGPYMLASFTPEGFTLKVNPDYWQKSLEPKVPEVYFPVYTSNTGALTALYSGKIDWTGNFIPGLQKNFVDTNPKFHHFYEAAGSSNAFDVNLHKWPTNQLAVRQAISLALNRKVLASEGEAGLENPVLNASGLTLPTFGAWSAPVKNLINSPTAQPAKAKAVLEKAGYTLKGGYFSKGGKEVSVTFISPSAYTDYSEVGSLAAQELKAAGIKASFRGLTVNGWSADVADGDFSISEHWSNDGLTPYNLYDNWLDSSLVSSSGATGDYERLHNPAIDNQLAKAAAAPTVATQTAALAPVMKYVANNLPVIPITTASEWFEYNSQHYVGWPTKQDPYETGQPSGTNNGPAAGTDLDVVLHLSPRG